MKDSKIQGFRLFIENGFSGVKILRSLQRPGFLLNKLNSRLFFILAILLASSFFVSVMSEDVFGGSGRDGSWVGTCFQNTDCDNKDECETGADDTACASNYYCAEKKVGRDTVGACIKSSYQKIPDYFCHTMDGKYKVTSLRSGANILLYCNNAYYEEVSCVNNPSICDICVNNPSICDIDSASVPLFCSYSYCHPKSVYGHSCTMNKECISNYCNLNTKKCATATVSQLLLTVVSPSANQLFAPSSKINFNITSNFNLTSCMISIKKQQNDNPPSLFGMNINKMDKRNASLQINLTTERFYRANFSCKSITNLTNNSVGIDFRIAALCTTDLQCSSVKYCDNNRKGIICDLTHTCPTGSVCDGSGIAINSGYCVKSRSSNTCKDRLNIDTFCFFDDMCQSVYCNPTTKKCTTATVSQLRLTVVSPSADQLFAPRSKINFNITSNFDLTSCMISITNSSITNSNRQISLSSSMAISTDKKKAFRSFLLVDKTTYKANFSCKSITNLVNNSVSIGFVVGDAQGIAGSLGGACLVGGSCNAGLSCSNGKCLIPNEGDCSVVIPVGISNRNSMCVSGYCAEQRSSSGILMSGKCAVCTSNLNCSSGRICANGKCVFATIDDVIGADCIANPSLCNSDQYCNSSTKVCDDKKANGERCSNANQCLSGKCTNGLCSNCDATSCRAGQEVCTNGECVSLCNSISAVCDSCQIINGIATCFLETPYVCLKEDGSPKCSLGEQCVVKTVGGVQTAECLDVSCRGNVDLCGDGTSCNRETGECEVISCTSDADCGEGNYCDLTSTPKVCKRKEGENSQCTSHRECRSNNCNTATHKCVDCTATSCPTNYICPAEALLGECVYYPTLKKIYETCSDTNLCENGLICASLLSGDKICLSDYLGRSCNIEGRTAPTKLCAVLGTFFGYCGTGICGGNEAMCSNGDVQCLSNSCTSAQCTNGYVLPGQTCTGKRCLVGTEITESRDCPTPANTCPPNPVGGYCNERGNCVSNICDNVNHICVAPTGFIGGVCLSTKTCTDANAVCDVTKGTYGTCVLRCTLDNENTVCNAENHCDTELGLCVRRQNDDTTCSGDRDCKGACNGQNICKDCDVANNPCESGFTCNAVGECVPPAQIEPGKEGGRCKDVGTEKCNAGLKCDPTSNTCLKECTDNTGCGEGKYCDLTSTPKVCREDRNNGDECNSNAQCSGVCVGNPKKCESCSTSGTNACLDGFSCVGGSCVAGVPPPPDACATVTCPTGKRCVSGNCVGGCRGPNECPNNQYCRFATATDEMGVCTDPTGETCSADTPCPAGYQCSGGTCAQMGASDCELEDGLFYNSNKCFELCGEDDENCGSLARCKGVFTPAQINDLKGAMGSDIVFEGIDTDDIDTRNMLFCIDNPVACNTARDRCPSGTYCGRYREDQSDRCLSDDYKDLCTSQGGEVCNADQRCINGRTKTISTSTFCCLKITANTDLTIKFGCSSSKPTFVSSLNGERYVVKSPCRPDGTKLVQYCTGESGTGCTDGETEPCTEVTKKGSTADIPSFALTAGVIALLIVLGYYLFFNRKCGAATKKKLNKKLAKA